MNTVLPKALSMHHVLYPTVLPGLILGLLLFNLYMLPLASIINKPNISFHQCADDPQLYLSLAHDAQKSIRLYE